MLIKHKESNMATSYCIGEHSSGCLPLHTHCHRENGSVHTITLRFFEMPQGLGMKLSGRALAHHAQGSWLNNGIANK
jgi:hypothetical protein